MVRLRFLTATVSPNRLVTPRDLAAVRCQTDPSMSGWLLVRSAARRRWMAPMEVRAPTMTHERDGVVTAPTA